MANWVGVITNAGAALLAEWVQGSVLSIDSAEAGTGTYAEATLMGRTALADYKQAASIVSKQSITNGYKVKIQVTAPTVAYTLNQFGLKASVNNGTPVLLAIFQNEDGIAIPSLTDAPDFVYSFYAILPIGNENDMSITIDTSALVSRDTLDEAIADLTTAIRTKLTANGGDARDAVVTFDDSDLDSGITSFQTFLTKIVSGMKIAKFFRDFKTGMAYVLHKGSLINNGTCNTAGEYALDAAYGKVLRDDIDSLNSSFRSFVNEYYLAFTPGQNAVIKWKDAAINPSANPGYFLIVMKPRAHLEDGMMYLVRTIANAGGTIETDITGIKTHSNYSVFESTATHNLCFRSVSGVVATEMQVMVLKLNNSL